MQRRFRKIFVVGLHRAGTSHILAAVSKVGRYSKSTEGHVWTIYSAAHEEITAVVARVGGKESNAYNEFLIGQIGADCIDDWVFAVFANMHISRFGDFWIDKTPGVEMIRAVPLLARRFPGAGFIFMYRRGIENLLSKFRRFGAYDFEVACHEWADAMSTWEQVKGHVSDRLIEVDQYNLVTQPEIVGRQMSDFLGFDERAHDMLVEYLVSKSTETTEGPSERRWSLSELEWTEEQKRAFREICGQMMDRFGFPLELGR